MVEMVISMSLLWQTVPMASKLLMTFLSKKPKKGKKKYECF